MVRPVTLLGVVAAAVVMVLARPPASSGPEEIYCPDYTSYSFGGLHEPMTRGRYNLPYQRPRPACRRFNATEVEDTIQAMRTLVRDPDLFRLFENCFPNTLDTAIAWHGLGAGTTTSPGGGEEGEEAEELTFITTGDINAMWLRDSANQLQSYRSLLRANSSRASLASLFRGAINLQGRYIRSSPHCNAFRPPVESNLTVGNGFGGGMDYVRPPVAHQTVFECKYELDSLAAFLQLSHDYFAATQDGAFFGRYYSASANDSTPDDVNGEFRSSWALAVEAILDTATDMLTGTYAADGHSLYAPYTFQRQTTVGTETLPNAGAGNPVKGDTGMVRSAFRPSDDACTFQLFVPANMMLARYLAACAPIMAQLSQQASHAGAFDYSYRAVLGERYYRAMAQRMTQFAETVRLGIERHGRVQHATYGDMYAYEVDGFGSHSLMDDANIPSLLSAPLLGYVNRTDPVYRNTRRFVLSRDNPYYMVGPVLNG